jgi:hypothetical protein
VLRIAKLNVAVERGRMLTFEQSLRLSKRGFRGLTYERSLQLWDPSYKQNLIEPDKNMKLIDDILQEKLLKKLDKLNRKIAWVGDRELRQKLDYHTVELYKLITSYETTTLEK